MGLVLLYTGLWWRLSVAGLRWSLSYCKEGCNGACLTVQRVVVGLVLLYRGLWWSLSYCTEGCDGACLTVQRVVVELVLLYRGL